CAPLNLGAPLVGLCVPVWLPGGLPWELLFLGTGSRCRPGGNWKSRPALRIIGLNQLRPLGKESAHDQPGAVSQRLSPPTRGLYPRMVYAPGGSRAARIPAAQGTLLLP